MFERKSTSAKRCDTAVKSGHHRKQSIAITVWLSYMQSDIYIVHYTVFPLIMPGEMPDKPAKFGASCIFCNRFCKCVSMRTSFTGPAEHARGIHILNSMEFRLMDFKARCHPWPHTCSNYLTPQLSKRWARIGLNGLQVGIPVLGVVENMSGLSQQLHKFRFFSSGPDGTQQDVTEQLLNHLPPDLQVGLGYLSLASLRNEKKRKVYANDSNNN